MKRSYFLSVINFYWASVIKAKEIHFLNLDNNVHSVMDSYKWEAMDFIDSLMENFMSIYKRENVLKVGDMTADFTDMTETDPKEFLQKVFDKTVEFRENVSKIANNDKVSGILSVIDNFINVISVEKYRIELQ